jgi:hypothetical protein
MKKRAVLDASYLNPIALLMWKLLQLGGGGYMVPSPFPFNPGRCEMDDEIELVVRRTFQFFVVVGCIVWMLFLVWYFGR